MGVHAIAKMKQQYKADSLPSSSGIQPIYLSFHYLLGTLPITTTASFHRLPRCYIFFPNDTMTQCKGERSVALLKSRGADNHKLLPIRTAYGHTSVRVFQLPTSSRYSSRVRPSATSSKCSCIVNHTHGWLLLAAACKLRPTCCAFSA